MNNRLKDIIAYKTGGKKGEFAALLGWTPSYLTKLIKGENFGLQPVVAILTALPEIDARWLILGEGAMLRDDIRGSVRRDIFAKVDDILEVERLMPVMTAEQLHRFEAAVTTGTKVDFSPEERADLQQRLNDIEATIEARFATANQKGLCRRKTAK